MEYLSRTADPILHLLLDAFGAVLIEGPKWCGKTTTAEQMAKSVIKLQDPDMQEDYLVTAQSKPSLLLNGETPRLIDEWQDIPVLWDSVRTMVINAVNRDSSFLQDLTPCHKTKSNIQERDVLLLSECYP